jgi:hypothetical protein
LSVKVLRGIFQPFLDNAIGDRLKSIIYSNPPWYIRPWTKDITLSDLIPWRCDKTWNTRFDIMNIPSLVFPNNKPKDQALLVVFDRNGKELVRIKNTIDPFKTEPIIFNQILGDHTGYGTFACFHHAPSIQQDLLDGSYFIDRQYVGFKRHGEPLWNFAHGNVAALTHRPKAKKFGCLTTQPKHYAVYRPQIHLNDCRRFELIYANPTLRKVDIIINFLDYRRQKISTRHKQIPPKGLCIFEFDNIERNCVSIEHKGPIELWRPIIFKYYNTHFDVLHS